MELQNLEYGPRIVLEIFSRQERAVAFGSDE